MSEARPIVYLYPGARWADGAGRQHLLCEALSAHGPVVFLATAAPGRSPFDVKRPRAESVSPTITVIHHAMSFRTNRWWKRLAPLAASLDGRLIGRLLKKRGFDDYIFWLSVPGPEWMAGMRRDRMVYDCIDPSFTTGDQTTFDAREYAVAREARLVLCTSQTLLERLQRVHPEAHLLNNAASPELYEAGQAGTQDLPAPLAGRPRPVVGYVGTLDSRIDVETVAAGAKALPDYTFCLAGRVNADQEPRLTELRALPNVVLPGEVPPEEGARYNRAFDVGIIPFEPGYASDALNPVKMYMYLMRGLPVVSTWIRECRLLEPLVRATRTPEEFAAALRQACEEPDTEAARARVAFAQENTWSDRARRAVALLRSTGLL